MGTLTSLHTEGERFFRELKESESLYRKIVQGLPVAFYICNAQGYITFYNCAAAELWGREPKLYEEQWCGSWKLFYADGSPMELHDSPMGTALREGRAVQDREIVVERPDGTRATILSHPEPFFDENGKVLGAINVLVDVTALNNARAAKERAEQVTRQSEAHLRAIFENSKDGFILVDTEGRLLAFNEGASIIHRAVAGTRFVPGELLYEKLEPLHREEVKAAISAALDGKQFERRVKYLTSENKYYWLKATYNPVRSSETEIAGVCIGLSDITSEMENQLHLSRLAAIVESSTDAIISRTLDGYITSWNTAAEKMFGYSAAEMIGQNVSALFPNDNVRDEWLEMQEDLKKGDRVERFTKRKTRDGRVLDILLIISPLKDADGKIVGVSKIARDVTDQEQLFIRLAESEERLRLAAEATEIGIWDLDLSTGRIIPSGFHQRILGYRDPEDRTWEKFRALVHPDDRGIVDVALERAMESGRLYYECRIIRPDLAMRWVRMIGKVVYKDQRPARILGTIMDITEQKVKAMVLYESEMRFRHMADQTPAFVWMVDGENRVTYCNQTFLEYIGLSGVTDFVRDNWSRFLHPEDLQRTFQVYEIAFRQHRSYSLEFRIREGGTGEYRWFLSKGVPRYLANQEFAGYIATAVDIHERKIAEQAVQESVDRMHFLADAMPQKIWTASPGGEVTYMNERWFEYSGISFAEFKQKGWPSVIHSEDLETFQRKWLHSIATGENFEMEHRFCSKSGEYRWHLTRSIPQRNDQGKILMWVGTDTDIDDKKRTEEELILANRIIEHALVKRDKALHELMETKQQLEEIMKVKEQFLSNMSHEIRTPMNAIVGFTNLILKTPLAPEQKQYIDAIKTSGENLLVIINDILDFSKLRAGAIYFEQINFRLSQLMSTLTELMLPKSIEKGIKLSVAIGKTIPDELIGDPTRLNQILLNLVGNAIKFTESGEVKIAITLVSETEEQVELKFSVMDTGIGIPEDKLDAIFEPFTQASNETTRKYGGSGLGLSIVRQFVEKQGGAISVRSTVGLGSTFTFRLSFGKGAGADASPETLFPAEETEAFPIQGLRILLVEDNQLNQILATKLMTEWKWEVELAENGMVAISKLEKQDFDVVLMDIQLPEMDGYQATRYIREHFKGPKGLVPILAMTAHAMQDEEDKCYKVGMNGYISKPFAPKMLYGRVTSLLEEAGKKPKKRKAAKKRVAQRSKT